MQFPKEDIFHASKKNSKCNKEFYNASIKHHNLRHTQSKADGMRNGEWANDP